MSHVRNPNLPEALAAVFDTEEAARSVLERAGVSTGRIQPFGHRSPLHYWEGVCRELARGLTDGGLDALLQAAASEYPGNPAFQGRPASSGGASHVQGVRVETTRLPHSGRHFVAREDELALLDRAWDDPHQHLISIVAWGGVGKTALVNRWLSRAADDDWRGAEVVYGWSFYSQGTEERLTSAFARPRRCRRQASRPIRGSTRLRGIGIATCCLAVFPGLKPGAILVRPCGTKRQAQPALLRSPEGGIR